MMSKQGIRMIRASGSRLEKMSLGRPCRFMTAACEVRLLLIWLYVSPGLVSLLLPKMGRRTVERVPQEHGAGAEATRDLVDPRVVVRHPGAAARRVDLRRLDGLPERAVVEAAVRAHGVRVEAALHGEEEQLQRRTEHRALGR